MPSFEEGTYLALPLSNHLIQTSDLLRLSRTRDLRMLCLGSKSNTLLPFSFYSMLTHQELLLRAKLKQKDQILIEDNSNNKLNPLPALDFSLRSSRSS